MTDFNAIEAFALAVLAFGWVSMLMVRRTSRGLMASAALAGVSTAIVLSQIIDPGSPADRGPLAVALITFPVVFVLYFSGYTLGALSRASFELIRPPRVRE